MPAPRTTDPLSVAYLTVVAAALLLTVSTDAHPTLGRVWDLAATGGAVALVALPFTLNARARGTLVGFAAFVILIHVEEWVRLTGGSARGWSVASLWLAALLSVIEYVAADKQAAP